MKRWGEMVGELVKKWSGMMVMTHIYVGGLGGGVEELERQTHL